MFNVPYSIFYIHVQCSFNVQLPCSMFYDKISIPSILSLGCDVNSQFLSLFHHIIYISIVIEFEGESQREGHFIVRFSIFKDFFSQNIFGIKNSSSSKFRKTFFHRVAIYQMPKKRVRHKIPRAKNSNFIFLLVVTIAF